AGQRTLAGGDVPGVQPAVLVRGGDQRDGDAEADANPAVLADGGRDGAAGGADALRRGWAVLRDCDHLLPGGGLDGERGRGADGAAEGECDDEPAGGAAGVTEGVGARG